jgi:hypothetical protein
MVSPSLNLAVTFDTWVMGEDSGTLHITSRVSIGLLYDKLWPGSFTTVNTNEDNPAEMAALTAWVASRVRKRGDSTGNRFPAASLMIRSLNEKLSPG